MSILKSLFLIGIGGGIGSMLRYLTAVIVDKYIAGTFPMATFTANMLGCLLIGIFLGIFTRDSDSTYTMLFVIGFCGGYTTFSTFAYENYGLIEDGNYGTAFLYIGLSIVVSLFAVWLGLILVKG